MAGYDIIGDVHGSGGKLHGLLDLLGWTELPGGERRHRDPDRQVVFVGDLVDRGSEQREVLTTVRAMVDAGRAQLVMGNHEFNALAYGTPHPARPDRHLRMHTGRNAEQHRAFLEQLSADERAHWLGWFATLPLWLDLGGLRVVHACWHGGSIDALRTGLGGDRFPGGRAGLDALVRATTYGDPLFEAVEVVLKGPEIGLGRYGLPGYLDKEDHVRRRARVRWWAADATTIADLIDLPAGTRQEDGRAYPAIPAVPATDHDRGFAYRDGVPVVYGHHWRQWEPAEHLDWTPSTACVDFSAVRDGPLVAYQWRGEAQVDPTHYVRFPADLGPPG